MSSIDPENSSAAAMAAQADIIQIRAVAKRNGFTTLLIGAVALVLSGALTAVLPQAFFLAGIFLVSASIVTMMIGWFKVREPEHSMEISREHILYRHRHGQWQLNWENVQRIDTPKITTGLDHKALGLVGIKIKDYRPLLESISPRLATNLLLEQRPLLLQSSNCTTGTCYGGSMLEDDKFKLEDGTMLKGIKAMMGHRMKRLRASLGYDLFISSAELDREADDFVALLRQCQSQVMMPPDR